MKILSDERFICQNCKTLLCAKAYTRWRVEGEEPVCRECMGDVFDMYNSGPVQTPAPNSID